MSTEWYMIYNTNGALAKRHAYIYIYIYIHVTNTTAAQNEVALSYHRVRVLYFLVIVFVRSIFMTCCDYSIIKIL